MAAGYGQPHSLSSCEYNVEEFMKARFARGATRLPMIRTAADLFHKQGARTTSPDEIIEASRTGKGQFYHYFRNKEGLIHEVLQTYLVASQVELQKDYEMTRGCPLGTLGIEVTDNDELVRQDLSLIFEVVKNKLAAFFVREKGKTRQASRPRVDR
jgi:TetR/AcrR family transcriptional repressor of nem operon